MIYVAGYCLGGFLMFLFSALSTRFLNDKSLASEPGLVFFGTILWPLSFVVVTMYFYFIMMCKLWEMIANIEFKTAVVDEDYDDSML